MPSDDQYVHSCLNNHPEAFRHLVERYQTPLVRCLHSRLGDMDRAEEAAQETFVRAYLTLGKLRKPEAFFSWLFGIADRVVKETSRAARRFRTADCDDMESPARPDDSIDRASPLADAIDQLPDVYRQVIVLRFHGEQSCAEIGRTLGVPVGTVTKRLSRAYGLLRERLRLGDLRREGEV